MMDRDLITIFTSREQPSSNTIILMTMKEVFSLIVAGRMVGKVFCVTIFPSMNRAEDSTEEMRNFTIILFIIQEMFFPLIIHQVINSITIFSGVSVWVAIQTRYSATTYIMEVFRLPLRMRML